MKLKSLLFLITMVWVFHEGRAVDAPTYPAPGDDLVLTSGKTIKEFFELRLSQKACQATLSERRKAFFAQQTELNALKKKGADPDELKKSYEKLEEARIGTLEKLEECGECATQEIKTVVLPGPPKEIWYTSDGTCYLPGIQKDAKILNAGYDRARNFLLTPEAYNKRNGGFRFILEFLGVEHLSGKHIEKHGVAKDSFYGFMAVKADILFQAFAAFTYYIHNTFTEKKEGDPKELTLKFKAERAPREFRPPVIEDVAVTGKKVAPTLTIKLSKVIGMWEVKSNGQLRYFTAAQFPYEFDNVKEVARKVHLDTLFQVSNEIYLGEAK